MKDNRLKYIFVLSLLLNFSLLGAAGFTYYQQNRYRPSHFGHGAPEQVPAESSTSPHLFETLALKPEQRMLFEQKAPLFHGALDQEREKVDRLRGSLIGLMGADNPDNKAIGEAIAEINGVQEKMQEMVVAHMLEFKSMLDKDQQKKFFDLIHGAMTMRQEMQCP
jgi:hypothetical protein